MRRLSRRETRLLYVLGALAVVVLAGFFVSPREQPGVEDVIYYYSRMFQLADKLNIRSPNAAGEPITVTRADHPNFFHRLATLARYGLVAPGPSPHPPKWILDIWTKDGARFKDVAVSYHLDSPKQPAKGHLWFFPHRPGLSEPAAVMVEAIDDFLASLPTEPPSEQPE